MKKLTVKQIKQFAIENAINVATLKTREQNYSADYLQGTMYAVGLTDKLTTSASVSALHNLLKDDRQRLRDIKDSSQFVYGVLDGLIDIEYGLIDYNR